MVSCVLTTPCKTSNNLGICRAMTYLAAAHCQICDQWRVQAWIWTTRCGSCCSSTTTLTARWYSTLLLWSGTWLLHGPVCSGMSLTRRLISGVDSCRPVWQLTNDTSSTCFDSMNCFLFALLLMLLDSCVMWLLDFRWRDFMIHLYWIL